MGSHASVRDFIVVAMEMLTAQIEGQHLLPYGDTLHSHGCGCPENWSKATRPADLVDVLLQQAFNRYQEGMLIPCRHLVIAYMLPHHNVVSQAARCPLSLHIACDTPVL